jgi:hypothetical protein
MAGDIRGTRFYGGLVLVAPTFIKGRQKNRGNVLTIPTLSSSGGTMSGERYMTLLEFKEFKDNLKKHPVVFIYE